MHMENKISIEDLRINNHLEEIEAEDVRTEVRIGKPDKQLFFRTHPRPEFRVDTKLLKIDSDNQWYFVSQNLWKELNEELSGVKLVTCINQARETFLWPIKIPPFDRQNKWTSTALTALDLSVQHWTRLIPDMPRNRYRVQKALSEMAEPDWPEASFMDLINEAFGEFHITSIDHPAINSLRGKL